MATIDKTSAKNMTDLDYTIHLSDVRIATIANSLIVGANVSF